MTFARVNILVFAMLMLSACSLGPLWDDHPPLTGKYKIGKPYQIKGQWYYPEHDPNYDEIGLASWYGPGFHGNKTANGEIFDQDALTAAHTTLPMPTLVRVTNLDNGRSLVLRVNDRGPFVKDRIIDVSRRAAEDLGFRHQGVARVRVKYLAGGPDKGQPVAKAPSRTAPKVSRRDLFVQAGALQNYENAVSLRDILSRFGNSHINTIATNNGTVYRIRLGPWRDWNAASLTLQKVRDSGFSRAQIIEVEERTFGTGGS
ncbi:MAG: septal ring lytic transglycosylase RlpA family protein [Hyphomicrobiales bacterium]|nr:septal ring lytic transglycosylase RlpA family protein [Hyphomicrobiales bacterium]MCY4032548.1 septal ring lytic transglycosylase RlpA family protein [Hyphomicrobiales bacterium]